jgi:hypothetical protein
MEQVLESIGIILRMILGGMFALTPSALFWLVVLGIFMAIQWVGGNGPTQRFGG